MISAHFGDLRCFICFMDHVSCAARSKANLSLMLLQDRGVALSFLVCVLCGSWFMLHSDVHGIHVVHTVFFSVSNFVPFLLATSVPLTA